MPRQCLQGDHILFGEEETLAKLREFIEACGVTGESADQQILRLTTANAHLDPTLLASMAPTGAVLVAEVPQPSVSDEPLISVADIVVESEEADQPALLDLEPPPVSDACLLASLLVTQELDEPEAPKGFIISISMRGLCRRLHFAGGCFGVPGEHYRLYESSDQKCPDASLYTHRCKDCFPCGKQIELKQEQELVMSEDGEASASSSSSSAVVEQEPSDS